MRFLNQLDWFEVELRVQFVDLLLCVKTRDFVIFFVLFIMRVVVNIITFTIKELA